MKNKRLQSKGRKNLTRDKRVREMKRQFIKLKKRKKQVRNKQKKRGGGGGLMRTRS